MNKNYKYICRDCLSKFSADEIESNLTYLCPKCGESKKNTPLKGVLTIEYNYEELRKNYPIDYFSKITSGKIWFYPDLWPIDFSMIEEDNLKRLMLPQHQILSYEINNKKISFLDETRNPTYSYKDRASILVALKAIELGITEITAASTGNAGSSLAGICARLGLKSHIFVPKNIPEAKRIQIQAYGANLYIVDGDYDSAFDLSLEISNKNNWYNRNTAYNPLTIEGKKSAAYDVFIQTNGKIPDIIFIPVGDGVIISGVYKGFVELLKLGLINKLPKLVAVQAEGSSAVVEYVSSRAFNYKPARTIADSISAGAPRNLYMAAEAIKETKGFGIKVSDDKILAAQQELANKTGLLVEPSCAASYAGYKNVKDDLDDQSKVMLLMTGSGMKDFDALKTWNEKPEVNSVEKWEEILRK